MSTLKRSMRLPITFVLCILPLFLIGCTGKQPTVTGTAQPPAIKQITPQVTVDKGALTVDIQYLDNGDAVRDQIFFLAKLLGGQSGGTAIYLPSVDPNNSPKGISDLEGNLVISNILPGNYALIVSTPLGLVMVNDAEGKSIMIQITANQVKDLGTIKVQLSQKILEGK